MWKFTAALLLVLTPAALLGQEIQTVGPEQVAGLIQKGQKVKLVLKTGTYGEGKVEDVTTTGLRAKINRSDNPHDLPTGMQGLTFDRVASITTFKYKGNKRTYLPLILCTTLGTLSLLAAGGSEELQSKTVPAALTFTGALGVGGYFGGRALDRQAVTIVIK